MTLKRHSWPYRANCIKRIGNSVQIVANAWTVSGGASQCWREMRLPPVSRALIVLGMLLLSLCSCEMTAGPPEAYLRARFETDLLEIAAHIVKESSDERASLHVPDDLSGYAEGVSMQYFLGETTGASIPSDVARANIFYGTGGFSIFAVPTFAPSELYMATQKGVFVASGTCEWTLRRPIGQSKALRSQAGRQVDTRDPRRDW